MDVNRTYGAFGGMRVTHGTGPDIILGHETGIPFFGFFLLVS